MSVDVERFRSALLEERKRVQDAMQYIHDEHPGTGDEVASLHAPVANAARTLDREMDDTLEENSGTCSPRSTRPWSGSTTARTGRARAAARRSPPSGWRRSRGRPCASTTSGARRSGDRVERRRQLDVRVGRRQTALRPISVAARSLAARAEQWSALVAVALAALVADQLTKQVVASQLALDDEVQVLGPFSIHHVQNSGYRVRAVLERDGGRDRR